MRIDYHPKLDFDDVLIRPKRSEAISRSAIEIEREYHFLNSCAHWKGIPLAAANMDTVGTIRMAEALAPLMMTCLHKYHEVEALIDFFQDEEMCNCVFLTLGIKEDDVSRLRMLKNRSNLRFVCVDVANGYTKYFVDQLQRLREEFPSMTIMAGNVATPEMVQELLITGAADIVKIGIGSGSVCTTRMITAIGYPQLSAIIECADAAHGLRGHVCADGGCRMPGDVVKAFAAGADFVMLGGMLAGHDECEGEWNEDNGKRLNMKFYGMASRTALDRYSGGRMGYRASEGTEVLVEYKGAVRDTIQEITGGIRSACAYVGASHLKELSKCTTFVVCNRTHPEALCDY